jgi:anaerobic selenocysteine-containing dehydrogenase
MHASSFPPPAHGTFDVLGACPHDCPDTCSLRTRVQDGVAVQVHGNAAHAHTGGVLCTKVSRYTERTYHPERVLTPLKRSGPKGSGQFVEVGWDEALADIATRLGHIAARDPQAILPYSYAGTMGLVQGEAMAGRFFTNWARRCWTAPFVPRLVRRRWKPRWVASGACRSNFLPSRT